METHQNKTQNFSKSTYYSFIDGSFKIFLYIGVVNSVMAGAAYVGGTFVFVKTYSEYRRDKLPSDTRNDVEWLAWIVLMVAGVLVVCSSIFVTCFHLVGQKVVYEIRWRYIRAILTKDTEWFESRNLEEIPSSIHANLIDIENGSGKQLDF